MAEFSGIAWLNVGPSRKMLKVSDRRDAEKICKDVTQHPAMKEVKTYLIQIDCAAAGGRADLESTIVNADSPLPNNAQIYITHAGSVAALITLHSLVL